MSSQDVSSGAGASRPLLVYDGGCNFCRRWIERWRARTGSAVDYEPYQEAARRYPDIAEETFRRSVVLFLPDGTTVTGARAVLATLNLAGVGRWSMALYERMPGFAPAAEMAYGFIARHRYAASRVTRLLWGSDVMPPSFAIARCVFLRLLGLVYLTAFLSLWSQVDGLIGSHGILPASSYLEAIRNDFGPERYWHFPTLAWFGAGDTALHVLCGAGTVLSILLMFGILPVPVLVMLWGCYLSLTTVGQHFLRFQWDNLLLESGLIAIFLAPLARRCRLACPAPPVRLALLLGWWLVFRLMFSSGVVKLSGGDPTWWNLTALDVHYETQPIPTWSAWYAHNLPRWFHRMSAGIMFAVELLAPFMILAPRRLRHLGAAALFALQIAIAATGNYGFFNLLSCALVVLMLDDTVWPAAWPRATRPAARWPSLALAPVAALIFLLGAVNLVGAFRVRIDWPAPVAAIARAAAPLRSVNWYGLFSNMTTSRPEIIVEGSHDGTTWEPYAFRWKPGDPRRAPSFTGPHMPRLDWQMWFAALGDPRSQPWIYPFMQRLLEGSPEVLALLEENPFAGRPPRFVRCILYDYRFTDAATRRATGDWWRREVVRDYTPPLSLKVPAGE